MPKKLQKSLQDYLFKIKKPKPKIHIPYSSRVLSDYCKHPKTLSFAIDRKQKRVAEDHTQKNDDSATLSDIDRFLYENFKSLYVRDDVLEDPRGEIKGTGQENPGGFMFESPPFTDVTPKLCSSHRFFVSPGISGSLIEEARTSTSITTSTTTTTTTSNSNDVVSSSNEDENANVSLPDQCVAVLACSPDPYDDFWRSMNEMVEARLRRRESVDWGFMEELLFCYLNLNDKKSYKYILSAFVDLVVVLRRRRESRVVPASPRHQLRNGRRIRSQRE